MKTLITTTMAALALLFAPMANADHPTPPAPVINPDRMAMPGQVDEGSYDEVTNITDKDGTLGDFDDDGPNQEFQNKPPHQDSPTWPGNDSPSNFTTPQVTTGS